jgi:VPS inhibitor protein D
MINLYPRQLKRKLQLNPLVDGSYRLIPLEHKGLVLSGGGAKGIGYCGMMYSMEQRGILKGLTHVSGASAGAMMASLLAVGMSSADMIQLVSQLDFESLFDRPNFAVRADGTRFRHVLEIIYIHQLQTHMSKPLKKGTDDEKLNYSILRQKLDQYKFILESGGLRIDSFQDIIDIINDSEKLVQLDNIFNSIEIIRISHTDKERNIETPQITFADLQRLRSILPEADKHLIKNLSVVTTNQSKNEQEVYNENSHSDESIAEKVQQSGAHPLLFTPSKNHLGESIADGGLIDNMPTKVLTDLGLIDEEILCGKIENNASFQARLRRAQDHSLEYYSLSNSFMDRVLAPFLGTRLNKGKRDVMNREKIFYHLYNMIYINSGTLTTLTTKPTEEQIYDVIEEAIKQTEELLDKQVRDVDNSLTAILHLGDYDNILMNVEVSDPLFESAGLAKFIFMLQTILIDEMNHGDFSYVEGCIQAISESLNMTNLDPTQKVKALALCLKQIDYTSNGELKNYLNSQISLEEDTQKVSFFAHLLYLLNQSIEWIFSLFSSKSDEPVAPIVPTVEPIAKNFGMFSCKEVYKLVIDDLEHSNCAAAI